MKVYISGKISGLDYQQVRVKFEKAEYYLREELKLDPVNPTKLVPFKEEMKWEDYMLRDIEHLFGCKAIYLLEDWQNSKGARVERAIAKEMGMLLIYERDSFLPNGQPIGRSV